jgi:hypothetical protein
VSLNSRIIQVREYPNAHHFVVAHSHGGNVAMYALADESLASRVSGVVCLGTPFFACKPRNLRAAAPLVGILLIFTVVISFLLACGACALLMSWLGVGIWFLLVLPLLGILWIIGWRLFFAPWQFIARVVHKRLKSYQEKIMTRLGHRMKRVPLHVVRVESGTDEAGRWLDRIQKLASRPFSFWTHDFLCACMVSDYGGRFGVGDRLRLIQSPAKGRH